jgi:hypothetical protein
VRESLFRAYRHVPLNRELGQGQSSCSRRLLANRTGSDSGSIADNP